MAEPILKQLLCAHPGGLHRIGYTQWSPLPPDANGRTVVCVHGLTRTGRDFDPLAEQLVGAGYRVVCPDLAGRGRSDRLADAEHYHVAQYVTDCLTLIARLDVDSVDWIGTSLGGLVGIVLASLPHSPIARLAVNDIGPEIEREGLERIRGYVSCPGVHADRATAEAALRRSIASFGPHDDDGFTVLSRHQIVRTPEGSWTAHYDPAIATAVLAGGSGAPPALWEAWEAIRVPRLVLRGSESDLLSRSTFERMCEDEVVTGIEFAGVGHAPTLIATEQRQTVLDWLATA